MSNQSVEHAVCCYVLKGSHLLFSDERIKYHFLKKVETIQKTQKWKIYGFCLTDDDAYFITETENAAATEWDLGRAAGQVLYQFESSVWGKRDARKKCLDTSLAVLHSLDEVADCCRQIHQLPLAEGYVSHLTDYWWSSYNTYTGGYRWSFLDTKTLLNHFSADREEAVCRFRHFHRSARELSDFACLKI